MKIARDPELEAVFLDSIRDAMSEPREGLHRSQLFPCPRKGKAQDVLKRPLTDEEALFYAQGRELHTFVVGDRFRPLEKSLVSAYLPAGRRGVDRADGGRIEVLDTPDGWATLSDGRSVPAEFKATRVSSTDFPDRLDQPLSTYRGMLGDYLWQLFDHCLWGRSDAGVLSILFFMGDYGYRRKYCPACHAELTEPSGTGKKVCPGCGYKTKRTDQRTYTVDFSDEDFAARAREVAIRAQDFVHAEAPLEVPPAPCWQCKSCDIGKDIGCEHYGRRYS